MNNFFKKKAAKDEKTTEKSNYVNVPTCKTHLRCKSDSLPNGGAASVSDNSAYGIALKVSSEQPKVSTAALLNTSSSGFKYRTALPVVMVSRNEFSVWNILKQSIGRDMSKITMPVVFNEPLTLLQRLAEYMEYAELLNKASDSDDVVERMQYVAAFAVSAISSNWERIGKPFNPLLGETYEFDRPDLGFNLVSEQVSHHPPVSAFHVQSPVYTFSGSITPRIKFWGKSVEVSPKGTMHLELLKHKESYSWHNVNCCVHNVVVGKLWVEHYGIMEITNNTTKHHCTLNFKQGGWFGKDCHKLDGYIFGPDNQKLKAIYGSWVAGLFAADVDKFETLTTTSSSKLEFSRSYSNVRQANGSPSAHRCNSAESLNESVTESCPIVDPSYDLKISGQQMLWRMSNRPKHSPKYYNFTTFAMSLNELSPGLEPRLPPTDSRVRPDVRHLEQGSIDEASAEKSRLEDQQRLSDKERKKKKTSDDMPLWFELCTDPHSGKADWKFNNKYYERDWSNCPAIF